MVTSDLVEKEKKVASASKYRHLNGAIRFM